MKLPIQISFHNLERIEAVEDRVLAEAAQLDEFCDRIMSCRVVVDVPHRHHLAGSLITASRRQELRIGAAEGVAEKVEGLHGTLLAAP